MRINSDWCEPIWFNVNRYNVEHNLSNAQYIAYGLPSWPSRSIWLVPGYEKAYEAFGVIDLYNPPGWFK